MSGRTPADATDAAPDHAIDDTTAGVTERLVALVGALRVKGVRTGTSETVDAAAVMGVIGLDDRERLRAGLASALIRRGGQREVFDQLFDLYFPGGVGAAAATEGARVGLEELRERLAQALATQDEAALAELAQLAVDALGRVRPEDPGAMAWSALQTLDRLQPQTAIAAALRLRDGTGAELGAGAGGRLAGSGAAEEFVDRLTRDELRRGVGRLRELVRVEARRRTAEVRGRERIAQHAVPDGEERIDFLSANRQQMLALRAAVRPLSRRLATRLAARRRRAHRGSIDIRRTVRRSMSTGGVPMRPALRRPRPARPELVLLCDVSGSVAGFSTFTMLLVQALADQFTKVRVFAFVNVMDEVTDLVTHGRGDLAAMILRDATVTRWHSSSDYGEALGDFAELYLEAVTSRSSVLVLGDGRNNFGDPNLVALQRISDASRRTFWLNPERAGQWGSGDSCALEYAAVVEMRECRTIEQMSEFVTRLLPV